jgi:Meckel syndrome type 1 protein
MLRLGSTGPDVVRVQSALGQVPDGVFGTRTDAAVRVFQGRNGLLVDGIVGSHTWGTLFGPHGASYDPVTPRYQFKIQRASHTEEAKVRPALAGKGPVAKIVLRTVPTAGGGGAGGDNAQPSTGHATTPSTPATVPAVDHSPPATSHHQTSAPEHTVPVSTSPVSTSCGSSRIIAPVKGYVVTGRFGEQRPGHLHAGIDLAVPYGTPIVAAACGVVTQAGSEGGYGNIVCIRHSATFTTCYAHMSRFASHVGQQVHQGQVIGYVGTTGDATGPHVHFETRVGGQPVDPAPYLSGSRRAKVTVHTRVAASSSSSAGSRSSARASAASASGPGGTSGGTGDRSTAKSASSGSGSTASGGADGQAARTADSGSAQSASQQDAAAPAPAQAPAPAPVAQAPAAPAQAPAASAPPAQAPAPAPAAPAPAPAPVSQAPAPAPAAQAPVPAPSAPAPAPAAQAPAQAPSAPAPAAEAPAPAPAAPAAQAPAPADPAPPAAHAPTPDPAPAQPAAPVQQAPAPASAAPSQAPAPAQPAAATTAGGAGN